MDRHGSTSNMRCSTHRRPRTPTTEWPRTTGRNSLLLRECFQCHSNESASPSVKNPRTTARWRHGLFMEVLRAPPPTSPLCWRSRYAGSVLYPTYEWPGQCSDPSR